MTWWHKSGFPTWSPIDLFEIEFAKIKARYSKSNGYVYIIEGANGWFKIGRTKNPVNRINKLGVVLPFPIEINHLIKTDDMYRLEKRLHEIFSEVRGKGEWFRLSSEDVKAISGLNEIFFLPNDHAKSHWTPEKDSNYRNWLNIS